METQFAATRGSLGEDACRTLVPEGLPRGSKSVLPAIERGDGGDLRLVHGRADRYRPLGVLGEGGMGVVERAEDIDIGRAVAIKRLLPEASHPLGVARFVGEVRIVGSLEHPNVAPIHDVGLDAEGRYFFVMKYVEGETLGQVIARLAAGDPEAHAAWPFERRAEVMISVLRALEYAHERGVIHRDIKPDNIMIGRFGEVWLMDWGIAKRAGEPDPGVLPGAVDNPLASLIGTPAYMSPEQARCDELDARSDLYAVAVTLHEFIGLRHYLADRSDDLLGLLGAIDRVPPPTYGISGWDHPHQPLPPLELRQVCARGMAKEPAERFGSAGEMIGALRCFLDGTCEVRCVFSLTKRTLRESGRFVDRNPRAAVTLMLAMVALALTGAAAIVTTLVA